MTSRSKRFMNRSRILFVIAMTAFQMTGPAREAGAKTDRDCVVLIHGLGRTAWSMKRLEWTLARRGYEVVNVSYPSRRFGIEQLAEDCLHPAISEQVSDRACRIHFVTHSMGGIILRQYFSKHSIPDSGRTIMLAPPSHGSEMVDWLKDAKLGRWILGPGGCQLDTAESGLPKRLGAVGFNLGVIAGDCSLNPWFSRLLPGLDDGKVSVESARVDGMNEFLVVPNSHTWMPWRAKTISRVVNYLQFGSFFPNCSHAAPKES